VVLCRVFDFEQPAGGGVAGEAGEQMMTGPVSAKPPNRGPID
jgi:hypothetical protein